MKRNRVHFTEDQAATEYRGAMDRQGFSTRQGRDREGTFVQVVGNKTDFRGRDDGEGSEILASLKDKEERLATIREASGGRGSTALRALKTIGSNMNGIARGMTIPDSEGRPRIARIPGRRQDIPIVSTRVPSPLAPKNAGIRRGSIAMIPRKRR